MRIYCIQVYWSTPVRTSGRTSTTQSPLASFSSSNKSTLHPFLHKSLDSVRVCNMCVGVCWQLIWSGILYSDIRETYILSFNQAGLTNQWCNIFHIFFNLTPTLSVASFCSNVVQLLYIPIFVIVILEILLSAFSLKKDDQFSISHLCNGTCILHIVISEKDRKVLNNN